MPTGSAESTLKKLCLLAFLAVSGLASIYFFGAHSVSLAFLSNIFRPVAASVSLLASCFALRRYWENLDSTFSRIWLCFTLGMMFWFLGELSWSLLTLVFSMPNPYPSIVDVYRLAGYVAVFSAIFVYMGIFQPAISKRIVATATAASFPTSAGIIPSILLAVRGKVSEVNLTTLLVSVAYPLFDLLLFATSMLGLLVFTTTKLKGKVGGAWLLLNAGILMNVFRDLLLNYTNLNGIYYEGHPLELFLYVGYIFFALAFYTHSKEL